MGMGDGEPPGRITQGLGLAQCTVCIKTPAACYVGSICSHQRGLMVTRSMRATRGAPLN